MPSPSVSTSTYMLPTILTAPLTRRKTLVLHRFSQQRQHKPRTPGEGFTARASPGDPSRKERGSPPPSPALQRALREDLAGAVAAFRSDSPVKTTLPTTSCFATRSVRGRATATASPRARPGPRRRRSPGRGALHHPIEARAPAGVAAAAVAGDADLEEDGVLVAVDARLDDGLDLAARRALAPELAARARPVPGLAGRKRPRQRLGVHVRDHQHLAGVGVGRDRGDEAVRAEAGGEHEPFLELLLRGGDRERRRA